MSHGVGMTKTRLQREDRNILDLQYRQISVTTIPLGVGGTNTHTLQKKGDGEEQIQGHRRRLSLHQVPKGGLPHIGHPEGESSYYQSPAVELKYITMSREP